MQIRIVTYNIRHCRGMDDRVDLERITRTLQELAPDIVCLQEVDYLNPRSGMAKQAERIAAALNMHSAYENNLSIGPFTGMGNAILTKQVPYSTWNKHLFSVGERRGLIFAAIEMGGMKVTIFCSHWGLSAEQRARQSEECAEAIHQAKEPTVMCGDLNATPDAPEIISLRTRAGLTSAGNDDDLTFTADQPYVKIDYVLVGDDVEVLDARPVQAQASDHLPFVADLKL